MQNSYKYELCLFFLCHWHFFAIAGCIDGACLCFGLCFGWIDFAGCAKLVAAGNFSNGYRIKFLVYASKIGKFHIFVWRFLCD